MFDRKGSGQRALCQRGISGNRSAHPLVSRDLSLFAARFGALFAATCCGRDWQRGPQGARHGQIREESTERSEEGGTRGQTRQTEERQVRQEGHEPQASHRHWPLQSPQKGREGSKEEKELRLEV